MNRRVRCRQKYIYRPVLMDITDPPYGVTKGFLQPGDIVTPVNLPGCPPPNTMGHCHIVKDKSFMGLVCTNSLQPVGSKVGKVYHGD